VKFWCVVTPERVVKTTRIMEALAQGWPDARIISGAVPADGKPFAVWGQEFTAARLLPEAIRIGRPCWHIDNGYWLSAKGHTYGYYRVTYRGLTPTLLPQAPWRAMLRPVPLHSWRASGRHILLALPGPTFGQMLGMDMRPWIAGAAKAIQAHSDRRIRVRRKDSPWPLAHDLRDAWAVVTHSSNVAVDAVLAGIPVFVAPTSPAAPVGNLDLARLDDPAMPEREEWLASLLAQQVTLDEMRNGVARGLMRKIQEHVDVGQL
jgi:hypothetical protein